MVIGNLLTFAAEFVVLAFAAVALFDFASGLWKLWIAASLVNNVNGCTKSELLTLAPTPQQEPQKPEPPVIQDPWLMTADATPTCCTAATIAAPIPLLLLPPASSVVEQPELVDLTALKLYKLHGYSVVRVSDLPLEIPATIKRYKLHKRDVVRLIDLEQFLTAL